MKYAIKDRKNGCLLQYISDDIVNFLTFNTRDEAEFYIDKYQLTDHDVVEYEEIHVTY